MTYEYPPVGGGMGKASRNLARALMRRGHRATVVTSKFGAWPFLQIDRGLVVLRIPVVRRHINFANAFEVLSFAGAGMLFFKSWFSEAEDYDACLSFLTIPSGIVAEYARLRTGKPWISFLRGQDVPGYPDTPAWMHKLAMPVTKYLWSNASRVLANSIWLGDLARKSKPDLDVGLVRNGIATDLYCPSDHRETGSKKVRVMFAGRLVKMKRLREVLEAWRIIQDPRRDDIELWFAGYGPERKFLEERSRELDLRDTIKFFGRLEEVDLIKALQRADIFVSPSAGEGLPNAVLEAMACELPVVLSDIGPHQELGIAEGGGALCDGEDPASIAAAIKPFLDDADLRRHHGRIARQRVKESFSWDAIAVELEAEIEKAIALNARQRR